MPEEVPALGRGDAPSNRAARIPKRFDCPDRHLPWDQLDLGEHISIGFRCGLWAGKYNMRAEVVHRHDIAVRHPAMARAANRRTPGVVGECACRGLSR
jgi:hypothetical protein